MRQFALAVGLGTTSLLLLAGQADAQYRYTDDKGVTKTTQYKLDVPAPYRDAAEWVGPTGIGKPALSEEARQTKLRDDAYRRIGEADVQLLFYKRAEEAQAAAQREVDRANASAAADRKEKAAEKAAAMHESRRTRAAESAASAQQDAARALQDMARAEQIRTSNETQHLIHCGLGPCPRSGRR